MAESLPLIPQDILGGITTCLSQYPERLGRLLYFLSNCENVENFVRVLKSVINIKEAFKTIIGKLADDTDHLETDPDYRRVMVDVWNNYLMTNENMDDADGTKDQRFDYQLFLTSSQTRAVATISFVQTLSRLPPTAQLEIANMTIGLVEATLGSTVASGLRQAADSALSFTKTASGKLVGVALTAVFLTYDILKNMKRWWVGEISGARCGKNVIDGILGMAAGVGGGMIGSTIGTAILPGIGTVIGGLIGGIASFSAATALSDWITQKLFNLPKEEALENAYRFLGLSYGASNDVINNSFRRLALQHHPDKGGSYENWHQLQLSMGLIKVSKGEI